LCWKTPDLYNLAARGLAYSNMNTTVLYSPSRSCIITGRNHHSNNMACKLHSGEHSGNPFLAMVIATALHLNNIITTLRTMTN
jgi:arylsulfatase A-like enzyme